MNVNVKITLTDEQRNKLYRRMTGKDVKKMASRADVCRLVDEYLDSLIDGAAQAVSEAADEIATHDVAAVEISPETGHEDCCRAVKLLHARNERLQRLVDTEIGAKLSQGMFPHLLSSCRG